MNKILMNVMAIALVAAVMLAGSGSAPAAKSTTAPTTSPAGDGPAKFYGTISAIDTTAKTFTIDNMTYSVVSETQMTKAEDGATATLADATVGQPARGSYTKTADGNLNVTKVRFGKKTGGKAGGGKSGGKKSKDATTQPSAQ